MSRHLRNILSRGRQTAVVRMRLSLLAALLILGIGGTGCVFYSFSGATIPSHLETIAIPIAQDNTANPINTLGRDLTNVLTDEFIGRTRLSLNNNETDADIVLSARIVRYRNEPTGVSGQDQATTNSVQIRVQARYQDQVNDSTMVDEAFTGTAEYDPTEAAIQGERDAAQLALERLAEDIFTTATSNW